MSTDPKKVRQAEIVSLHRPSGELTFRYGLGQNDDLEPGDVVQAGGVAFTVSETGIADGGGRLIARAYVAQIENLGDVEPWVLRLREGDIVVLTSKVALDEAMIVDLAERVKLVVPGYQVMVLDSNIKIGRIRPDVGTEDVLS